MFLANRLIFSLASGLRKIGVDFGAEHDARVLEMKREIRRVGGRIEFKIEQYPDGSWTAESANIDGIITGGKNMSDTSGEIRDAIFTYFGIPPHLCDDGLLKANTDPVIIRQQVYV